MGHYICVCFRTWSHDHYPQNWFSGRIFPKLFFFLFLNKGWFTYVGTYILEISAIHSKYQTFHMAKATINYHHNICNQTNPKYEFIITLKVNYSRIVVRTNIFQLNWSFWSVWNVTCLTFHTRINLCHCCLHSVLNMHQSIMHPRWLYISTEIFDI